MVIDICLVTRSRGLRKYNDWHVNVDFFPPQSGKSFLWPDAAVPAVTALEKAAHETLSSDFQKYNQKLRQLVFNLKVSTLLHLFTNTCVNSYEFTYMNVCIHKHVGLLFMRA